MGGGYDGNITATQQEHELDAPKEIQEADRLDDDANERPLEEHEQDAPDEAERAPQLLFPREEVERLLRPDDQRQPGEEQELHARSTSEGP